LSGDRIAEWDVQNNTINFVGTSVQTLNPYEDYGQTTHGVIAITDVANGGTQFINTNMQFERNPDISADGNYVAFESSTNLTDEQIFVFDRVQQTYTDISASLGGSARGPSISGDGNYVVFTDVVNGENDLYVWDRASGQATEISLAGDQRFW
jgi:Tol biopolymer transport system component